MVAVIRPGKSLNRTLNYNEQKVMQGKAFFIHAENYAKDTHLLGFTDKLKGLQQLARRNERTKVNSVHISLNFDPSEKLSPELLRQVADAYMEKIGFADQPYLVYEHKDAGHPHIHIVTTNIRPDATRIELHNIGRNQSEKARKEIEKEFNLVRAEGQKSLYTLQGVTMQKVQYGKSATKRAITNVLDAILTRYKYASLPELNAVLKGYNVLADRGAEDSRTYKTNGLVYRVLDEKGEKTGVPIKASDFYSRPTMQYLEKKFLENAKAKLPYKTNLKNRIDGALQRGRVKTFTDLAHALQKEKIQLVLRQNKDGLVYGLTYVDHDKKVVFNGSDLGKAYSTQGMRERFTIAAGGINTKITAHSTRQEPKAAAPLPPAAATAKTTQTAIGFPDLAEVVFSTEETGGGLNPLLREEERKKKRRKKHRY